MGLSALMSETVSEPQRCSLSPDGSGNIHVVFISPAEWEDRAHAALAEVQRLAICMDGTITGEHGIGLPLRDLLIEEIGDNTVDMMRQVYSLTLPGELHLIIRTDKTGSRSTVHFEPRQGPLS